MTMDEKQADAVARAILEPGLKAQDDLRRKRDKEAVRLAVQRRAVAFALVGMALGAAVGYFVFARLAWGLIIGGIAAYLLALLVQSVLSDHSPKRT